jgi:hypothetical protein
LATVSHGAEFDFFDRYFRVIHQIAPRVEPLLEAQRIENRTGNEIANLTQNRNAVPHWFSFCFHTPIFR